jgi:uncharacterized protein YciI
VAYFVLECVLADDYEERRAAYRPEHLQLLQEATDAGLLLLAGALTEPTDRSLLVWTDPDAAVEFMAKDPYSRNGLVLSFQVRPWAVAIGAAHQS